jgi:hypothetical protein
MQTKIDNTVKRVPISNRKIVEKEEKIDTPTKSTKKYHNIYMDYAIASSIDAWFLLDSADGDLHSLSRVVVPATLHNISVNAHFTRFCKI